MLIGDLGLVVVLKPYSYMLHIIDWFYFTDWAHIWPENDDWAVVIARIPH